MCDSLLISDTVKITQTNQDRFHRLRIGVIMFGMFYIMFYIVFFLVIAVFIFVFVKSIGQWIGNNNSPRLSVEAKIADKRTATYHHHGSGHCHSTYSYYITFEVRSGDRMELAVPESEFGLLIEGDEGILSFRGTRYLGFERKH